MHELLAYIDENIFWIIIFFIIFGSSISATLVKLLDGRRKTRVLAAKNKALTSELKRANETITALAAGKTAPTGSLIADLTGANARMARILDQVQAADEALPQLDNALRSRLDIELDHYHQASAPKGITS